MHGISLPPIKVPEQMEIRLTDTEDQMCSLLDECSQWMKDEKSKSTSCRIAGGWVRDKLLGSDSNDIDVALEDMMGLTFAEAFVEFVTEKKNLAAKAVSKVESNPDQSKHLETAKTTVLNTELDFVNLRSEEYAEDSRIPTEVTFGTPLQDALRRDITINALFYNVHTRSVEDHTEKGLDDLRNGIIRTPLPPKETFTDDPLRIIRCIRFASRFGFEMVPELREAASDPTIKAALVQKISRERVGEELHKMMKGRDPLGSINLINELGLYTQIFHVPEASAQLLSVQPTESSISVVATAALRFLVSGEATARFSLPALHPLLLAAAQPKAPMPSPMPRLYFATALTPYRDVTYTDAKGKVHQVSELVIREGLKLGTQNHYLDGIPLLFTATALLKDRLTERSRVAIGLLLRDRNIHNPNTGSHWGTSLLFSLVQELVGTWSADENTFGQPQATQIVEKYNAFVSLIDELDLTTAADAKPLLDGREVVAALGAQKPGQWTGQALASIVEWQLGHPTGTKDECIAWLKDERDAGRIKSEDPPRTSAPGQAKRPKDNDGAAKKARHTSQV